MVDRLKGKVAIVTGAAGGIGLAAARLFAQEGGSVVACDMNAEGLRTELSEEIAAGALAVEMDVSSEAAWAQLVPDVVERFGRVDVLVNNAGVQRYVNLLATTLDDWNFILSVNLTGTWLGLRAVIPQMQAQGGGSIVNVSSIAAIVGGPSDGGSAAYSASKGGVRSLTKHAAQWYASDSIRVNSIHPGSVYTGMAIQRGKTRDEISAANVERVPLPPHIGDPADIAYGMLYLASDESAYVTGEELVIDGGWTTR